MIGPLISERQRERVMTYVESGRRHDAEIVADGAALKGDGFFVQPTVFANASADLKIVREEIFGPTPIATPWTDRGDRIRVANYADTASARASSRPRESK